MRLHEIFEDANGRLSSKRVFALICMTCAIVLSFVYPESMLLSGSFLTAALALLGITAATKT